MNTVKGLFQNRSRGLWERPFDFYVAALLFAAGLYSIINDHWPEDLTDPLTQTFIVIVSIYLMIAGAIIMASLLCKRASRPVFSLMAEMYGWMFVAAGSLATIIMYISAILHDAPDSWVVWCILISMWIGMFVASSIRFYDIFLVYRSLRK